MSGSGHSINPKSARKGVKKNMRVISLYQPYASLVVLGLKQFETRGWDTKYRGPLAIHATKATPTWCQDLIWEEPFKRHLYDPWAYDGLPTGCIIGTVELANTINTTDWLAQHLGDRVPNRFTDVDKEYFFGDYSPGRFAWELRNPVRFVNPIPARGSQGFWNFDLNSFLSFTNDTLHLLR